MVPGIAQYFQGVGRTSSTLSVLYLLLHRSGRSRYCPYSIKRRCFPVVHEYTERFCSEKQILRGKALLSDFYYQNCKRRLALQRGGGCSFLTFIILTFVVNCDLNDGFFDFDGPTELCIDELADDSSDAHSIELILITD